MNEDADIDVIVVGAGLAGLTAARLAQRHGARVVVLDGQPAGGRARTDARDGFLFNRGPHALYLGGAAARVLGELGVPVPGGPPSTHAAGLRGDEIGTLPANARSLLTTPLLGWRGKVAIGKLLSSLPKLHAAEFATVTVRSWLDTLRLPADAEQLLLMLIRVSSYANAPDVMSAELAIAQLQIALDPGVRYLDGGWQSLVDALQSGVDVRRAQVIAVRRELGRCEVTTADGQQLTAASVIVATGTPTAMAGLLDRPAFEAGPPVEAACLDLGAAGAGDPTVLFGVDRPLYLSTHCPPARLAPPGRVLVHVARYLAPGDDLDPAAQRAELEAHAARTGLTSDRILASRYLHRMTVVGALATAEHGGLAGRPAVTASGIDGVFLAGDWIGAEGHLADASLASASVAARLACAPAAVSR